MHRLSLLSLLALELCFASHAGADARLRLYNHPLFRLECPAEYDVVKVENPSALLALRDKTSGTTFNVVVEQAPYDAARLSVAEQAERIRDSYQAVGIASPQVISSSLLGKNLWVELGFHSPSAEKRAFVVVIPAADRHFYLTMVSDASTQRESERTFKTIVGSWTTANFG